LSRHEVNPDEERCATLRDLVVGAAQTCHAWAEIFDPLPRFASTDEFMASVPIVDRDALSWRPWSALIRGGDLQSIAFAMLSSGTTGSHRVVGMLDTGGVARESARLERAIADLVQDRQRTTLVLNTLPDGLTLPLRSRSLLTLNTGGRVEVGSSFVAQLGNSLGQLVMIGEPGAVLAQLEHTGALITGVSTRVLVGGEMLTEIIRERICRACEINPDRQPELVPLSSLGMAEVGFHLLWETPSTVALRRALIRDPNARDLVCPGAPANTPSLMSYDPEHLLVECVAGELVLTRLDSTHVQPIIRYNSHDRCGWVDRVRAAEFLAATNPHLASRLPEQLVWVAGRQPQRNLARGQS
jgi:hypothetical protein